MRINAQLKADEARDGMRVTYGTGVSKVGTLTGETRVVSGVTRFKVRPIDGGRAVWAVYVWEDTTSAPAVAPLADPRVFPVRETYATGANMFDPELTFYADGTRVVVRGVSPLASDMWDGRTGVTVGRLPAFPYGYQAVQWDDNGQVDNVVPHILHELPTPVAPLAPGDRVEIDGRERVVTSIVPSRFRGRRSLYVAHTAPGDGPWAAGVTTVPVPLDSDGGSISPRVLAAHVLTSAGNTFSVGGPIIPETPPAARREYVAARERGEGVSLALSRARAEMAADAALSPAADYSCWEIDAPELLRVTLSPGLDALSGAVRDAAGKRLLFPVVVPDGIMLTVSAEYDADTAGDDYPQDDAEAWREDEWEFRTVVVTARDADGTELATAALGGVEVGSHWPGGEEAQIWPHIPGLVRQALEDLPDDALPMTCGTCGHRFADNTPSGRCPREADHESDDGRADALLTVRVTWNEEDRCPVVHVDALPGAGHVQVQLGDTLIYDADPELSPAVRLVEKVERLHELAITALRRGNYVSPAAITAITEP